MSGTTSPTSLQALILGSHYRRTGGSSHGRQRRFSSKFPKTRSHAIKLQKGKGHKHADLRRSRKMISSPVHSSYVCLNSPHPLSLPPFPNKRSRPLKPPFILHIRL